MTGRHLDMWGRILSLRRPPVAHPFRFAPLLVGFGLLSSAATFAQADYAQGVAAYAAADYTTAVKAFTAAAQSGDAQSQYMLGRLYAMGLGVPQDFVTAWVWSNLAAQGGNVDANAARATLEDVMTPQQLARARAAAPSVTARTLPPVPLTDIGAFPTVSPGQEVARMPDGMPEVLDHAPPAPPQSAQVQSPAGQSPGVTVPGTARSVVLVPRSGSVVQPSEQQAAVPR